MPIGVGEFRPDPDRHPESRGRPQVILLPQQDQSQIVMSFEEVRVQGGGFFITVGRFPGFSHPAAGEAEVIPGRGGIRLIIEKNPEKMNRRRVIFPLEHRHPQPVVGFPVFRIDP